MRWTKRLQEVSRAKDFTCSECARSLTRNADDALSGLHYEGRGKRIDISARRHSATFLVSHTRHYLNEESLL